jgi:hypothetical protein
MEQEDLKILIDTERVEYEKMLLACVYRYKHLFDLLKKTLCRVGGEFVYDFDVPLHNALYRALYGYYSRMSGRVVKPPARFVVELQLKAMANAGNKGVFSEDIPDILKLFDSLVVVEHQQVLDMAMSGFSYWLSKQRIQVPAGRYRKNKLGSLQAAERRLRAVAGNRQCGEKDPV